MPIVRTTVLALALAGFAGGTALACGSMPPKPYKSTTKQKAKPRAKTAATSAKAVKQAAATAESEKK